MERLTLEQTKDRLASGEPLAGCDLGGLDLTDVGFRGVDLRRASFHKARLMNAELVEANLVGANLEGANLIAADARSARMGGVNLHGADLTNARLEGAYLGGADLSHAMLFGTDLTGANLIFSDLSHATMLRTQLAGVGLMEADLTDARMADLDLTGVDLSGANFTGARLQDVRGLVIPPPPPDGPDADGSVTGTRAVGPDEASVLGDDRGQLLSDVARGLWILQREGDAAGVEVRRAEVLLRKWLDQVVEVRDGELSFDKRGARTILVDHTAHFAALLKRGWRRIIVEQRRLVELLDIGDDVASLERHLDHLEATQKADLSPPPAMTEEERPELVEKFRRRREDRRLAGPRRRLCAEMKAGLSAGGRGAVSIALRETTPRRSSPSGWRWSRRWVSTGWRSTSPSPTCS